MAETRPEAAAGSAADEALVDLTQIADIVDTLGAEIFAEMVERLCADAADRITQIETLAASDDIVALAAVAHAFKSAAGSLGLSTVHAITAGIEHAAESGHLEEARSGAAIVRAVFDRSVAVVRAPLALPSPPSEAGPNERP